MKSYTIFVSLLFLLACHQDSDEIITVIDHPDPPTVLISTGLVTVLDNGAMGGTQEEIIFNGESGQLNDFNFKAFRGTQIDRDYSLIQLNTAPNLTFYKVTTLVENDINYAHLTLPDLNTYAGTTAMGADILLADQSRLIIPANSISNIDGTPYEGSYKLIYSIIPADDQLADAIPSHTGVSAKNEIVSMQFETCYYINLQSPGGGPLAFTSEAGIHTQQMAQSSWLFDAATGIWITKTNQSTSDAIISISHSGYYAQADAKQMIRVNGILNINESPAPHYPMSITYEGQHRKIYTTNTGKWAVQLPALTTCTLSIEYPCGDSEQIQFTTGSSDEMTNNITVTNPEMKNTQLLGTVRDCQLNPVEEQYTILEGYPSEILFNNSAAIHHTIPVCQGSLLQISSLNPLSGQSGPSVQWTAMDTIDLRSSFACNQAREEYLYLTVSGDQKVYWDLKSERESDRLIIGDDDPQLDFNVYVEGLTEGQYEDTMLNISFEDMYLGTRGYSLYCPTASSGCGFTNFTITHFAEAEGQWIRGYFEGTFWVKTFNPLTAGYRPVSGEFQVYREF